MNFSRILFINLALVVSVFTVVAEGEEINSNSKPSYKGFSTLPDGRILIKIRDYCLAFPQDDFTLKALQFTAPMFAGELRSASLAQFIKDPNKYLPTLASKRGGMSIGYNSMVTDRATTEVKRDHFKNIGWSSIHSPFSTGITIYEEGGSPRVPGGSWEKRDHYLKNRQVTIDAYRLSFSKKPRKKLVKIEQVETNWFGESQYLALPIHKNAWLDPFEQYADVSVRNAKGTAHPHVYSFAYRVDMAQNNFSRAYQRSGYLVGSSIRRKDEGKWRVFLLQHLEQVRKLVSSWVIGRGENCVAWHR